VLGGKKLEERDILEIHRAIMAGIISTAGQYRRGNVRIAGASFSPPPAYEVEGHIWDLVEYVNANPDELRPIELAAHAHYYIAWIHPFDDGNGRMARILMNMLLARNRYPFAIIRNVERKKYINMLDAVSHTGNFEPFFVYIARCVEQTLDIYLNAAKEGKAKEKLMPLLALAKGTPYSAEYLSLQARKGVLDAIKVGRVWMSTRKTIRAYMREHGRK
jgi:Fic family protein